MIRALRNTHIHRDLTGSENFKDWEDGLKVGQLVNLLLLALSG